MKRLLVVLFSILLVTGCSDSLTRDDAKNIEQNIVLEQGKISESVAKTKTISSSITTKKTTVKITPSTKQNKKSITTYTKNDKTTNVNNKVTKVVASTSEAITTRITLSEKEAKNKILALKKKYPTGTSWNNDNRSYKLKAENMTNYTGRGCVAFAFMASDEVFGTLPVKKITTFDNIKTGDIIRYLNNKHSVIVLEVKDDNVVIAEGNIEISGYSGGVVYWERVVHLDEIKETGTYIYTRWM